MLKNSVQKEMNSTAFKRLNLFHLKEGTQNGLKEWKNHCSFLFFQFSKWTLWLGPSILAVGPFRCYLWEHWGYFLASGSWRKEEEKDEEEEEVGEGVRLSTNQPGKFFLRTVAFWHNLCFKNKRDILPRTNLVFFFKLQFYSFYDPFINSKSKQFFFFLGNCHSVTFLLISLRKLTYKRGLWQPTNNQKSWKKSSPFY